MFYHHDQQDCATRWGSKQKMVQRLLEQESAVRRIQAADPKCISKMNWSDKDVLTAMNAALKPVSDFTDAFSGETYVTISSIIPALSYMKNKALCSNEGDVQLTKDLKEGMLKRLEAKYDKALVIELMRTATFIDPRYRGTHFDADVLDDVVRNVEQGAVALAREMEREAGAGEGGRATEAAQPPPPPKKKKTSLGSLLGSAAAVVPKSTEELVACELAIYKQEAVLAADGDPLDWWKKNEPRYPLLANVARKYLCICATSTASERVFSTAGQVVSSRRSLLKPAKVDMLVFLAKNL